MKTIFRHIAFFALFITGDAFAQDVTTVRANNSDISDNLDLKAVASIFGESNDLEDFERRLNDPDTQISNLDLNGDNKVDYLRVIEATENNTHLIIIQSVLGADVFQDVATIEVERDRNNNVQVQVVGDVYMYGQNYIYEPVYAYDPFIFNIFWVSSYRPYYSPWYWGYYPTYYNYWAPCPVYRYRNHIHTYVNPRNSYVYANSRRSSRAATMYNSRRQNAYERQHPNTSFSSRNNNVSNRYTLEQNRAGSRGTRSLESSRNSFSNSSRVNNVGNSNINTVRRNGNAVRTTDGTTVKGAHGMQTVRTADAPARSSSNAVRNNSSFTRQEATQPIRVERSTPPSSNRNMEYSTPSPSRNVERSAPVQAQRSAPAPTPSNNNINSPARSSMPAMRSTPAPAPARQSAPAPSSQRGGGGSRRG
jgi:hypothetical protein